MHLSFPKSRLSKALTALGLLCGGVGLAAVRYYSWHEVENKPLVTQMPPELIPHDIELLIRELPKTATSGPRPLVSEEDRVHFKVVLSIATREVNESFISQVEKLAASEKLRLLENLKVLQLKEERHVSVASFEKKTGVPLSPISQAVLGNADPVQGHINSAYDKIFNARANVEEEYNRAVELALMASFYRTGGRIAIDSQNQWKVLLPDDVELPLERINEILGKAIAEFPNPKRER